MDREKMDPRNRDIDISALREIAENFPLEIAVMFGSHARGETDQLSDLDLALKFEEDTDEEERFRMIDRVSAQVMRETGVEKVDLVDLDRCRPEIGYRALREGKILIGSEEEADRLEAVFFQLKTDFKPLREEWQEALHGRIESGNYGKR